MRHYKKNPVEIMAVKWAGNNIEEIVSFAGDNIENPDDHPHGKLLVRTKEGPLTCEVGCYIIKGILGEFYPCDPEVFERTYTEVLYDSK